MHEGSSNYFSILHLMDTYVFWLLCSYQFSQFSHLVVSDCLQPNELQHARPPCPSPTPRAHSNSCPSIRGCHPAISSSVVPFSSCPQSLPASGSFSNESTLRIGNDPVEKKVLKEARGMESSTQVRERNKDSSFIIMIIIIISHCNSSMLVDLVRTC